MMKYLLLTVFVALISSFSGVASSRIADGDLAGTWIFSVDLDNGQHGDPTFVFKQEGGKLTGTYTGPLGEQTVTGTVTGNKAVFGFNFIREEQTVSATYTGTVESPGKMTGTLEFSGGQKGKWTASKKAP